MTGRRAFPDWLAERHMRTARRFHEAARTVLSALAPPCRSLTRTARSLRTLHDAKRDLGAFGETEPTGGGGNELVVMTVWTEEIAKLTMLATEALRCLVVLETPHTSDPSLDAAMILLKPIV